MLLIGGASGSGKTMAARQAGLRLGLPWLQVDDLRLAFQHSQVVLPDPQATRDLYFFAETTHVWRQAAETLRDGLIASSRTLLPALEIVVANHIDTDAPLIIEGDNILPELVERPLLQPYVAHGQLQMVFLQETDADRLRANIEARARGTAQFSPQELQTEARAKWLYSQWLTADATRLHLPVLEARPWETLAERIILTCM
ncbi:hypothetical protein KSZ_17140 [Dictyobacter formicarum]|uniref:Uncharacterized protein n=1 Tax=Dictyobacter formicarum TaxID=2778368 RepID=A0ABQ3VDG8_9CHLR|nr:hypothetical protein KSZ_17140 [Dictyobacter formicarum]